MRKIFMLFLMIMVGNVVVGLLLENLFDDLHWIFICLSISFIDTAFICCYIVYEDRRKKRDI